MLVGISSIFDFRKFTFLCRAYLLHAMNSAEQRPRKSSPAVAKISVIQGWSKAKLEEEVDLIEGWKGTE